MAKADKQIPEPVIREVHEYLPRRRSVLLGYLLLALLVAILLVFGVRTVYRHLHKSQVKFVPAGIQRPSSVPANTSGNVPKSTNAQSSSSGNLPNSGPGQVAGLFIGASLAAAGLHFMIGPRKYSKPD